MRRIRLIGNLALWTLLGGVSSLVIGACGGATTNADADEPIVEDVQTDAPNTTMASAFSLDLGTEFPLEITVGPGTGPALFLDENSPPIGYISPGVAVRVMGPAQNGRFPVRIYGPLKIRGHLDARRIGTRVQERGRVRGAPVYVGPGDLVGLRQSEGELRHIVMSPDLGYGITAGPFEGVYPESRLGMQTPGDDAEAPTAGETVELPVDQEVQVYDRPGGEVVATLPAHSPGFRAQVLRDGDEWKGVRIGFGPYLIGYVNVALTPTDEPPVGVADSEIPRRLMEEASRPLFRVAEGGRVKFEGRTFAIFEQGGFARQMNRYEDEGAMDAFTAVNDDIAVRGMIDLSQTEAVNPPAPEPEPEPEPEEDDFDSDF